MVLKMVSEKKKIECFVEAFVAAYALHVDKAFHTTLDIGEGEEASIRIENQYREISDPFEPMEYFDDNRKHITVDVPRWIRGAKLVEMIEEGYRDLESCPEWKGLPEDIKASLL